MGQLIPKTLLRQGFRYIRRDQEKNLLNLAKWAEVFTHDATSKKQLAVFREAAEDKNSPQHRFIMRFFRELDPPVIEKVIENFILNASWVGFKKTKQYREKYNINIPWALLIDPTSACNLNCIGCWAADYQKSDNLSLETMDRIITEAKELGTYMFLFSGGEPLIRKTDLLTLARKHNDAVFAPFTNATLIDEKFAAELRKLGNFVPIISIEGNSEQTDARRGKGTYDACMRAMHYLHENKVPFGYSTCYHRNNTEYVASDEYIDEMINAGALFGWYFTYIPLGKNADTGLIATPEQRAYMYKRIREIRKNKAIFVLDFWNDAEYEKGCIAGGRQYLHINARGDVEPCAFIHYSVTNIHGQSLLEALKSPLFLEYKKYQPFNENMLRPCPLFDNPEYLVKIVKNSKAHSTHLPEPEDVESLYDKCKPAADAWAPVAERLWEKRHD
ncbi:MAG TPA: radical SAM protein [Candidatus Marinimicrobia bacterium]|nr:radical SAM protein [Candidatus Neomarinimicrobiota bacterium]